MVTITTQATPDIPQERLVQFKTLRVGSRFYYNSRMHIKSIGEHWAVNMLNKKEEFFSPEDLVYKIG